MEINQGYAIRRVIAFDNECGFVLGENPKAPDPYVTWQFNMRDGERNYFWGHYCDDARLAESDLKNRAEDYQRRYYVERIEQPPEQETYKYYSTQRPIDVGTYPNSRFNGVVEMTIYPERWRVEGEAFRAWGEIDYAQQLLPCEVADYELRPSRHNPDIRREMDAQAQIVGAWEDAKRGPEQKRLTWFYPDFGSYVSKEHITPEQLAAAVDDFVALPPPNPARPAPHATGGALDLTLCYRGRPLPMGTEFDDFTNLAQTAYFETNGMAGEAEAFRNTRRLLYNMMTAAGFVNYSEEWWHYSYGDRLWARTFGKTPIYGLCDEKNVE